MQKTIIALTLGLALANCKNGREGSFELKGQLTETNGETIYLEKLTNPQPVVVDSASVDSEGNFEFENYTPNIGYYRIKSNDMTFALLVLDSADKVFVKGNIKDLGNTYEVTGSPETSLFKEYNQIARNNKFQTDSLNNAFQVAMQSLKMDSLKMDSLSKVFQPVYETIMGNYQKAIAEKITKNTDKYASLIWVQGLDPDKYSEVYSALDKGLSKRFPDDKMVRQMHEIISKEMATNIGKEAPEIVMQTPEGNDLALSSLKGKVVLIDFWASWCGPCRKEMPSVVKLYEKYKNKGFEIFGVSLDKNKEQWVEAIKKDGITWPQVSDLKFWDSDAAKLYAVSGIPYTVLLDKEGKILAKGLRGAELEKAIEKVMAGESLN